MSKKPLSKAFHLEYLCNSSRTATGGRARSRSNCSASASAAGPRKEASPVIGIVPVEIGIAESPAHRGLADLARPGDQGHLTMSLQVILQNSGIEAEAFSRATIVACVVE